ncbi:MAG TPA: class I SAM-dependent methyltransferase [Gaiellaceae bacterium]|nr:class I SAM-dependent methyltransferase [Gaiellaceae bacterium]
MSLSDPDVVRRDYASEARLLDRRSLYEGAEGPDAREVVWRHVAEALPRSVLEVGPGPGELSERIALELGANVVAIDVSPRMVELTRARGIHASVGDVQALPFADGEFDLVAAAWVLFHAADLDRALAEIERVLRPGGRLVAATNSEHHLEELWELVGGYASYSFSAENGETALKAHFGSVAVELVEGWVTFADTAAARNYVASSIVCGHLVKHVPLFPAPLRARRLNAIFVATKAAL